MDFEYVFDAWGRYIKENRNAVVLSDTLGAEMTRSEVEELSGRVCAWLRKNNISTGDFVLINLERGVKPVVAVMGVWKAGAAFSLVESTYAKERIEFIRRDCQPKLEINEQTWAEILETAPDRHYTAADDHDVCFIVYTSGTTGTPKGVIHEYGQLKMEMISEKRDDGSWRENTKTRWGLVAPLNFVASLKIVVHFLYSGGHLFVMGYDTVKDPRKLTAYFLKNRINETFLSPSLLRLKGRDFGPFMKYIYTGSEPANHVSVKGAELNNTYTMSESFFTVCEFIIDKPYPVCPIGLPRFDLDIKLIDEAGHAVAPGETGEFCYYNPYCRGYINNPEENKRHFINGYFHTGDLAEFKDGRYILKGRSDDMIKIDGNRIEPSEIEAVCKELTGAAVCIAKGFESDGFVALYYTGDITIDVETLRARIAERLPYYMIPSRFIHIDSVPLTPSGKLNRSALKKPTDAVRAEYAAPRDEFETMLCEAFSKVLGVEKVGIKDDFFALGGSSIKVMELLSMIKEDNMISPTMVYEGRTAEKISELHAGAMQEYLTPEQKESEGQKHRYPISRNMQWYWNCMNDCSIDFYNEYKLSPIVPAKLLAKRLNDYIKTNSTFNMVLEPGEDGVPVQVYVKETPFVQVERMSRAEFEKIERSFVRPFGYGEPLIRIRLIQTFSNTYLLFHAFHMITDGNGIHLFIEDIVKSLKKQPTAPSLYFAWAYDENVREHSKKIAGNLRYFKENYFDKNYDICLKRDENTGLSGIGISDKAGIPLESVRAYCRKKEISMNTFIIAAVLLAQCEYNRSEDNMVIWNYNNRGPGDNHAGMLYRSAYSTIHRSEMTTPDELYESINRENQNNLWRLREFEYFAAFERASVEPSLTITYLEDWFTGGELPRILGEERKLTAEASPSADSELVYVLSATHEHGKLCMELQYGRSYNTPESVNRFIALLGKYMESMVTDVLPKLSDFIGAP